MENVLSDVPVVFLRYGSPCSGCCPVLCTFDGPPPSGPPRISVLELRLWLKPGEDEVD